MSVGCICEGSQPILTLAFQFCVAIASSIAIISRQHYLYFFNSYNHFPSLSAVVCGLLPVPRRFDILFNVSNQKGAPIIIASTVRINPSSFNENDPAEAIVLFQVSVFHPSGMTSSSDFFAILISFSLSDMFV